MRSDLELLLLAAKAAGLDVWPGTGFQADMLFRRADKPDPFGVIAGVQWNPLTDDGDALRLARRLNISTEFLPDAVRCKAPAIEWVGETCVPCDWDLLGVAHRRTIVRAAAEIGAKMQEG